jgi:hypothetical protein
MGMISISFMVVAASILMYLPAVFSPDTYATSQMDRLGMHEIPVGDPVLSSTSHFPNICINCTTPDPPSPAGSPGPVGTFDFFEDDFYVNMIAGNVVDS